MFEAMVKKLKKEFGFLKEEDNLNLNKDVEKGVIDQLDRSSKLDEIDTVTFGLETDDGKIVKVYVNAEQADEFEKALAEKLGEIDDIEEVLNELSKDFEIVDVEWPDEKADKEEGEDLEDGQPETDGSEIMNQKVWDSKKSGDGASFKAKMEGLDFTSDVSLTESADGNSIESRLTTATQLLIYHAILELGIPEIALNKSPYKGTIVNSLKDRATDMQKDPDVKTALKMFVQRAIDGTGGGVSSGGKGKEKDAEKDDSKDEDVKMSKDEKKEKDDIESTDGEKKDDKKNVKEALQLVENLASEFWHGINVVLTHIGDPDHLMKLKNSTKFKALVSRSMTAIPRTVKTELRMRMNRLTKEIGDQGEAAGLIESVTAPEIMTLLTDLFELVDPTSNKDLAKAVLNSMEWKAFMLSARPTLSQKFRGAGTQRFRDLMASTEEAMALAKPSSVVPSKVETIPGTGMTESTKLTEAAEWTYDTDKDDNAVIAYENLKFTLDQEELEKAVKAINSRSAIVLVDAEDPKSKVTFSPRGINMVVKKVGDSKTYPMSAEQLKEFMKFAVEAASGEKTEDKEDK